MPSIVDYSPLGGVARRSGSRLLICRSRFDSSTPIDPATGVERADPVPTRCDLCRESSLLPLAARPAAGPHRLAAQVTALSRLQRGFESRWGHQFGRLAQLGEHLPYTQGVGGSSPVTAHSRFPDRRGAPAGQSPAPRHASRRSAPLLRAARAAQHCSTRIRGLSGASGNREGGAPTRGRLELPIPDRA